MITYKNPDDYIFEGPHVLITVNTQKQFYILFLVHSVMHKQMVSLL